MFKPAIAIAAAFAGATMLTAAVEAPKSAFDFRMTTIDGKPMPFNQYKGKVLLVVNTASMCGYTPQYEGLQALQDKYKGQGFTVIGVPSADFDQELESDKEIKTFCESKFGIKFPMSTKSVVTGEKATPFYRWAAATLGAEKAPKWNFHKYLVGRDGKLIAAYPSKVTPESAELTTALTKAIATKG
jgi:glutathione peroxidase